MLKPLFPRAIPSPGTAREGTPTASSCQTQAYAKRWLQLQGSPLAWSKLSYGDTAACDAGPLLLPFPPLPRCSGLQGCLRTCLPSLSPHPHPSWASSQQIPCVLNPVLASGSWRFWTGASVCISLSHKHDNIKHCFEEETRKLLAHFLPPVFHVYIMIIPRWRLIV